MVGTLSLCPPHFSQLTIVRFGSTISNSRGNSSINIINSASRLSIAADLEKAARRVVEISDVGERQRLQRRRMLCNDGRGSLFRGFLRGSVAAG
jgi:ABC-type hemin transport system ATPase subunit